MTRVCRTKWVVQREVREKQGGRGGGGRLWRRQTLYQLLYSGREERKRKTRLYTEGNKGHERSKQGGNVDRKRVDMGGVGKISEKV